MKCGYDFFRLKQHWFFHRFTDGPMYDYLITLGFTGVKCIKFLKTNGGAWFPDFSIKTSNYDKLSNDEQLLKINTFCNLIDNDDLFKLFCSKKIKLFFYLNFETYSKNKGI